MSFSIEEIASIVTSARSKGISVHGVNFGPPRSPEDIYHLGRVMHAVGSKRCKSSVIFYKWNRIQASEAVVTWLMCARRLGLYYDVARIIGEYVFQSDVLYRPGKGVRRGRKKLKMLRRIAGVKKP